MRLHRFYIQESQGKWEKESLIINDPMLLHQIIKVLRLKEGDNIVVFHETKGEYEGQIKTLSRKTAEVFLVKQSNTTSLHNNNSERVGIRMFVSVIKKDRFEFLVEKLTELGVSQVIPIVSDRTTTKNISVDRLKKISIEATEQSGQIIPTEIVEQKNLVNALERCEGDIFVLHTEIKNSDNNTNHQDSKIKNIFIGPEGGWSDHDLEIFSKYNAKFINLKTPILRAETAAIIAAYEFSEK